MRGVPSLYSEPSEMWMLLHFQAVVIFLFSFQTKARDIKVVRPIYGVELFDGETARFEVEISEDDVHGQWKLNGEVLSPSSVSAPVVTFISPQRHRQAS